MSDSCDTLDCSLPGALCPWGFQVRILHKVDCCFPLQGCPDPGIKPSPYVLLQCRQFLPTEPLGKLIHILYPHLIISWVNCPDAVCTAHSEYKNSRELLVMQWIKILQFGTWSWIHGSGSFKTSHHLCHSYWARHACSGALALQLPQGVCASTEEPFCSAETEAAKIAV